MVNQSVPTLLVLACKPEELPVNFNLFPSDQQDTTFYINNYTEKHNYKTMYKIDLIR